MYWRPPYGALGPVTIPPLSCVPVPIGRRHPPGFPHSGPEPGECLRPLQFSVTLSSSSNAVLAEWITIDSEAGASLRCWWARPGDRDARAGVLVLPEVFGVNGWVRGVAERLAREGYAALAMPLFARTAPALELTYDDESLRVGRSHKERTTAAQLLEDVALAADWLQATPGVGGRGLGCVGFCFGGHVAMLAATLPQVAATCDFYGAGVVSGRPGGGPPTLELVSKAEGPLLCVLGNEDPLIPPSDRIAIEEALDRANRLRAGRPAPPRSHPGGGPWVHV